MIEIEQLRYRYKGSDHDVLHGVSFQCRSGAITGILGPNGAGKSTLFKVLSTQLEGSSGSMKVQGLSVSASPAKVRERIGVVFQSASLDPWLTVEENLLVHTALFGVPAKIARQRIEEGLQSFGLVARRGERVRTLSGGLARRVELLKCLLTRPEVLLLDEPTTGLDPQARQDFWSLLVQLKNSGMTLVVSTHLMDEAELCDELVFLASGTIRGGGSPKLLRERFGKDLIYLESKESADAWEQLLKPVADGEVQRVRGKIRIQTRRAAEAMRLVLSHEEMGIDSLEWVKPSLAEVYFANTGEELGS